MPYNPDPRPHVNRQLHQACLHAYYELTHLLSDADASLLMVVMSAYSNRAYITRRLRREAWEIISKALNAS